MPAQLACHRPRLAAWTPLVLFASLLAPACDPPAAPGAARKAALVTDPQHLLGADSDRRIRTYLDWVRGEYGIDYRVVIARLDGVSPEVRALRLFEERGAGRETGGKGLLLLVDPVAQQVRVEVGYALEPYLTDVAASRMLSDYLAPYFRAGEAANGIEASIEALVDKLEPGLVEAVVAEESASPRPPAQSGGALDAAPAAQASGGAGASLDLLRALPDVLDDGTTAALRDILVPQPDPRQARDLEIALLHRGIYLQDAALYDDAWRRAARPGGFSAARLREIARQWDRPYEIAIEGPRAIAYYADAPALGPTFLKREAAGWIIDASHGARAIVYDYSNDGWYALDDGSPYLAMLARALPLRRVTLQGGRAAWQLEE